MKKCACIAILAVLLTLFVGQGFAVNISPTNKSRVDSVITVVEQQKSSESLAAQLAWYEKVVNSFSRVTLQAGDQKEMIEYLLECFQQKINVLKSQVTTQNEVIGNIDRDRVKQEWLAWHNYEREQNGLTPYTYNETLNFTALNWAQQLANEKRGAGTTHIRQAGDGYFPTENIRQWFSNLGVKIVDFSESNAYGYYSCTKIDCTEEMINVLKKRFLDVFLNKQHYKAVVNSAYDQIGLGVARNGNYIWITTHYGANVK